MKNIKKNYWILFVLHKFVILLIAFIVILSYAKSDCVKAERYFDVKFIETNQYVKYNINETEDVCSEIVSFDISNDGILAVALKNGSINIYDVDCGFIKNIYIGSNCYPYIIYWKNNDIVVFHYKAAWLERINLNGVCIQKYEYIRSYKNEEQLYNLINQNKLEYNNEIYIKKKFNTQLIKETKHGEKITIIDTSKYFKSKVLIFCCSFVILMILFCFLLKKYKADKFKKYDWF